jgi:CheY-like chemotaxis protein/HPt (histidine-containing phosphotransfer) domain-containing protein
LNLSLPLADGELQKPARAGGDEAGGAMARRRRMRDIAQAESEGSLVLLVDDHPTNRMLLQRQLNTLGYAAETAEDGEQALRMWKSGRYGIVITDCEMPGMDGYTLAQAIRAAEAGKGGRRTPVLACTAHALAGEVDKCLAVGMDDCLVKPIDLRALNQRLQRWLPLPAEDVEADGNPAPGGDESPVDLTLVRETWGDDTGTVRDMLSFFQRANNEDAAMLRRAVAAKDLPLATRATHRMLGASKMVGAHDFAETCERINGASRAGAWESVEAELPQFEQEWMRLNTYIDTEAAPE